MRKDMIYRQDAIDALDRIFDRCEEIEAHLQEGDPDRTGYKMYPDYMTVWNFLHQLPSAHSEIIRCKDCKYAEVADTEDSQDGYTCQFHRGSIWFSGSYCSWAKRRTDE